jgi:lysylphosphatidylglycerol synthetase-like protein (DUF2156 family)
MVPYRTGYLVIGANSLATTDHSAWTAYAKWGAGEPWLLRSLVLGLLVTSMIIFLILASAAIGVTIIVCARRGKLHIPGYVGLAFLAFAVALVLGRVAGARAVSGTHVGVVVSILYFLLIAVAVGSILALFFYRHPPQT